MSGKRVGVHLSDEALHDIESIIAWYTSQAAWQAAEDVAAMILEAIEGLAFHPEAAPIGVSGNRERVISAISYRVVYFFDALHDRVNVNAVVHTRRQWPSSP